MSSDELMTALDELRVQWERVYELLLSRVMSSSAAMVVGPYEHLEERIKRLEVDLAELRAELEARDAACGP
jgi:polyhydroxyalkanoate synthesis regulator phasin